MSDIMDMTPNQFESFKNFTQKISIEVGIIRLPRFLQIVRSEEEEQFAFFYFKECIKRAKLFERKRLASFLEKAYDYCQIKRISMGIEAMSRRMCDTLKTVIETSCYLQDMGLKDIGVVVDNYHMVENNEQLDDLLKVHLISHVHISNPYDREPPKESDSYYHKLFTQLLNCNYNNRVSIECNAIFNPMASMESFDYLRSIGK